MESAAHGLANAQLEHETADGAKRQAKKVRL